MVLDELDVELVIGLVVDTLDVDELDVVILVVVILDVVTVAVVDVPVVDVVDANGQNPYFASSKQQSPARLQYSSQ
jgi:hypothetical protein